MQILVESIEISLLGRVPGLHQATAGRYIDHGARVHNKTSIHDRFILSFLNLKDGLYTGMGPGILQWYSQPLVALPLLVLAPMMFPQDQVGSCVSTASADVQALVRFHLPQASALDFPTRHTGAEGIQHNLVSIICENITQWAVDITENRAFTVGERTVALKIIACSSITQIHNSHRTVKSLMMTCSENGRDLFQANLD